jgi:signal peptide peptidase SppA
MAKKYPNVVRAISEHPWAILPQTLETILEIVGLRASGVELTAEEIQARIGSGPAQRPAVVNGSVAIVPLYGVLFPRANLFTEMSGGTSLQQWAQDFERSVADPNVSSILIDVNSPGGSSFLVPETAERIRAARGQKPIWAIANTLCASAAYWLASQADEVIVTPSALIGSIGVYTVHEDWSKAWESLGIDITYIYAGKFKVEGNFDEPLSDDARTHAQEIVDDIYAKFVGDVAKGRAVRPAEVRNGFGQGRVVPAQLSVELGIADRVDTFEKTVARLARGGVKAGSPRAELPLEQEPQAAAEPVELDGAQEEVLASVGAWAADTRADMHALPMRRALDAFTTPTEATQ